MQSSVELGDCTFRDLIDSTTQPKAKEPAVYRQVFALEGRHKKARGRAPGRAIGPKIPALSGPRGAAPPVGPRDPVLCRPFRAVRGGDARGPGALPRAFLCRP